MKKNWVHLFLAVSVICMVFFMAACIRDNKPKKISIAMSMATFRVQRWSQEVSTITRLAKEKGIEVIALEAKNDVELQRQHISDFIDKKIPVIIIVAVDGKTLSDIIDKAYDQGVHIIAYDRLIHSPNLTAYVSFDNIKVGRLQASAILKSTQSGNFVLLGGSPTDNNAHLVRKGQLDIFAPYIARGQIKIIEDLFIPNWEAHLAFLEMEKILKKYNNQVDAVVASNDEMALGAIQALKIQGLNKKIPVSGQDASIEGCKAIAESELTVSVFKDINQLAPLAFGIAEKIIHKKRLNLSILPLKTLSLDKSSHGYVPCKLLDVTAIDKNNLYEKIILTQFHKWDNVYKDLSINQRPPKPSIDEKKGSKKSK